MNMQLAEIAEFLNGNLIGDGSIRITGVGEIDSASDGEISFVKDNSYLKAAKKTNASALIVPEKTGEMHVPVIESTTPYHDFIKILEIIAKEKMKFPVSVHRTVISGTNVKLGNDISLAPYVVMGDGVVVGDKTIIGANTSIGNNVSLGKNCLIYPNVAIGDDTFIGNDVIIHSGTVIGSDGCGFIPGENGLKKVPQIGYVIIEDNVEIGSNCSVDRATMNVTKICKGTKLDNQVHIAHNVTIGDHSILLAHCTIGGSNKIGKYALFSGQVGTVHNIKIGDKVTIAEKAAATKSLPGNSVYWGNPAHPINDEKKVIVLTRKLPELYAEIKNLKERISFLEAGQSNSIG